jgi:uncharacterized membrane protein
MEALVVIGIALILIGLVLAFISNIDDTDKAFPNHFAMVFGTVLIFSTGIITYSIGIINIAYQDALDLNPYTKEYIYQKLPNDTLEKYDSIYVRIEQ